MEKKTEIFLSTNSSDKLTGMEAVAQQIHNLLLIEQGTYPSEPLLGIGIEGEQFELLDSFKLESLKNKIENQIEQYIVTDYSISVNLTTKNISTNDTSKVLVMDINIVDKLNNNKTFTSLFLHDKTNRLISKVLI